MQTPKEDFLSRIINIYGSNMTAAAKKDYYKACDEVLKGDIDYRKLWQEFLYKFATNTIGSAPSPQWLYKASLNYKDMWREKAENLQKILQEIKKLCERQDLNQGMRCFEILKVIKKAEVGE